MNKKAIIIVIAAAAALACAGMLARFAFSGHSAPRAAAVPGASALLSQIKEQEGAGNLLAAKELYQKLLSDFPNSREIGQWQRSAEDLNMRILFSPVMTPQSVKYEVQPGDSLEKIAKSYKTTVELIKRSNALTDDRIYAGMKLRVWNAPFAIFVDKSQNLLLLKCNEEVIKTYTVSTGSNNCTPVGTFKIIEKIVNPPWYKDGRKIPPESPENILGTRWMGIDKEGYGIHGTTAPESLGKQATAGCVRMANKDVEELFSIIPQGTVVTIVD